MSKEYSPADVAPHKDEAGGYWVIIENGVYDVTSKMLTAPIARVR